MSASPEGDATRGLRTKVLRGGTYLIVRQAIGSVIGFGAVMLIVRAIGPAEYGLAATATGLCTYALGVLPLGIGAYLVRHDGEVPEEDRDQALTCLLLSGLLGVGVALAAAPLIGRAMGVARFAGLAASAFAVIPVSVLATFPLATLERGLDYRRIALIELVSQLCGHATSLALTYSGLGAFALVVGFWVREVVSFAMLVHAAPHRPRLRFERARARKIMKYGLAYAIAGWTWQAGNVVAPIVVMRLAGADVLGVVSLANRFIEHLNLVATTAQRLGFAALAKVQRDRDKLSKACSEAMLIQVLAIGLLVFAFGVGAQLVFPTLLGERWAGLLAIYPFLALCTLVNAAFSFHVQVLHVLERSWDVTRYFAVRIALFVAGLALLLPSQGLIGYGYAEMLGFLGYPLVHAFVARRGVRVRYGRPLAYQAVFGVALFWRELGWPVALAPLAALLWPETWRIVGETVRSFRGRPAPGGGPGEALRAPAAVASEGPR